MKQSEVAYRKGASEETISAFFKANGFDDALTKEAIQYIKQENPK